MMTYIQQLRERESLAQWELGEILGVKQATISKYEARERRPSLEVAKKAIDLAKKTNKKHPKNKRLSDDLWVFFEGYE